MIKVMLIARLLASLLGLSFEDEVACWVNLDPATPDHRYVCELPAPGNDVYVIFSDDTSIQLDRRAG